MRSKTSIRSALMIGTVLSVFAAPAVAQEVGLEERIARLEALVAQQDRRLAEQDARLAAQAETTQSITDQWRVRSDSDLALTTARGAASVYQPDATPVAPQDALQTPLAAPPVLQERRAQLGAIPEGMAVLTRPGVLSLDFSGEYTRSSANRLVFRGIEIVPGIQIGVIEANEADRDTFAANAAVRFGLTDRIELEARVPYVRRNDTVTTVQQRDEAVTRTIDLKGDGIGDVEAAIRYQFNRGERGRPIFVGAMRVKTDTGEGPFDIDRDEFGVATRLATGSGFWGVEPSVSMLFATDPAVIFANLSYFAHLPRDIDQMEGDILIGEVDPGDSIGAAIGFGFALNPKFSYSLGYRHNYILPTSSELNDLVEESDSLQVGALLFGMSYRFSERFSLNGNFEFGVTGDAPDMRAVIRIPLAF